MSDPVTINPTLTVVGQAAAFNASNTGIELIIDGVSYGTGHYDPTGNEVALTSPVGSKVALAGGSRATSTMLRLSSAWKEDVGQVAIGEIGFWAGDVLAFVWSKADGTIASYKTDGVTYVLFNDLVFTQVPANSINVTFDPDESAALAALTEHEGAANAHPQYLLRDDVLSDSGPLSWLGAALGTASAMVLSVQAEETVLTELAAGQRFQFLAAYDSTGATTANIEGLGAVAVKKVSDGGLVDLEQYDIRAGALYDLNYDGTYFQLGGGVGSSKAYTRFSFTAAVAQSVFTFPHTPGSIVVLRNGREVVAYASDAGGTQITLTTACALNDSLEVLAFKTFTVADTYTKAELDALLAAAGGAPVGMYGDFPGNAVPVGWLIADANQYPIAVYPDLYAVIGTTYNTGTETAGYFRVPGANGLFRRSLDLGAGIDPGRVLGSVQADAFLDHWHTVLSADAGTESNPQSGNVVGSQATNLAPTSKAAGAQLLAATLTSAVFGPTAARKGTETRPKNIAAITCIKAFGGATNQGFIDVAALATQVQQAIVNGPVIGSMRNGRMALTAPSASGTFTADEIIVANTLGGIPYKLSSFSRTLNLATVGAGGMDTGAAPVSGYVGIYAIYNPTTKVSALLSVNATAALVGNVYGGANMPAGFTSSALIGVWPTTSGGLMVSGTQLDRQMFIVTALALNTTTAQSTATALSIAAVVPLNAKTCHGTIQITGSSTPTNLYAYVGGSALNVGSSSFAITNSAANGGLNSAFPDVPLTTPQTLYYADTSSSGSLAFSIGICGYTI